MLLHLILKRINISKQFTLQSAKVNCPSSLVAERLAATSAVSLTQKHKNKQKNQFVDKLLVIGQIPRS